MEAEKLMGNRYWVGVLLLAAVAVAYLAYYFSLKNDEPAWKAIDAAHWSHAVITESGSATGLEGCDPQDTDHFFISGTKPDGRDAHAVVCCRDGTCVLKHP